ncbi:hypothetical protein VRK_41100 [Vibrio sp. MEBiC08052]|nr:hypothetical protein VRK_41100 [Vibrio sp. MEBiC08052]
MMVLCDMKKIKNINSVGSETVEDNAWHLSFTKLIHSSTL